MFRRIVFLQRPSQKLKKRLRSLQTNKATAFDGNSEGQSNLRVLPLFHSSITPDVITQRGAALSHWTLPNRNDYYVLEKRVIEGLVFKRSLYLSSLIKLNKSLETFFKTTYCRYGLLRSLGCESQDTIRVRYNRRDCGCSWPVSSAAGCNLWWYAGRSGPSPSAPCFQGCRGCCARPATCPAGSPPLPRSATKQQAVNRRTKQKEG